MGKVKPSCFLSKECHGYFCMEPVFHWIARDSYRNTVAYGRTKSECAQNAREKGYTPR